jgi:exopolyphosphatase/guanosine-5'-triphosphate,3'-diphosphate pyrophosphatase
MRLASIDIGTNSVKLLVADVEDQQIQNILLDISVITRLGENVDKSGEILPEAMDRTLDVINDFKDRAKLLDAVGITVVATSAMRDAKNNTVFAQKMVEQTGLELQIISGDEEAELSFLGTCSDSELQSRSVILIDVGGGSTEFIIGQGGNIEDRFSIDVGCVRLTEEFIHSDPIEPTDLQNAIHKIISMLYTRLASIPVGMRDLIGIGGTVTSLASVHQNMEGYTDINVHKYVLPKEQIVRLLIYLRRMTLDERRKLQGLDPQRADIIVAGAAIFSTIMEILKSQEIIVSTRGLRYGALLKRASLEY